MKTETAAPQTTEAPWSEGRSVPLASLRLGLRRALRGWRLLLALGLGMLVTVVLICVVPLYTTLVPNVELQHILATSPSVETNFEFQIAIQPYTTDFASATDARASALAQRYLHSFAPTGWTYSELSASLPVVAVNGQTKLSQAQPALAPGSRALPMTFDYAAALPHMRILSGGVPQDAAPGQPYEVLVTPQLGLAIGDTMELGNTAIPVKVGGVWEPKDPNDAFWNLRTFDVEPSPSDNGPAPTYPLLFSTGDFVGAFATPQTPPPGGVVKAFYGILRHYLYFTQHTAISTANLATVEQDVQDLRHAADTSLLQGRGGLLITQLDTELAGLVREVGLLAQPLYVVVAQVVGLALLFIAVIGGLLIEGQAAEIATLKSRGASVFQLLANVALQGGALVLVAAVAGPFLAVALSLVIVRVFVPAAASLTNGFGPSYLSGIISPGMVVLPAVIGALLALAALLFAAWRATRMDVLAFRRAQGRESEAPFWKRYYLDLGFAVLCIVGYLELGQFGGLNVRAQLGQKDTGPDFLQLAAPALLLLAGALVALRLFPLGMALGARLAGRGRGATGLLAFAQVARGSGLFARLTLLLLLSVGIGFFALTFQSSLARASVDRAAFLSGADQLLQLPDLNAAGDTTQMIDAVRGYPGVTALTGVYASTAGTPGTGLATTRVFAVDPSTFAQVAYWRSDYASQPLSTLLAQMASHRQGAQAGDENHPLWALVDTRFAANNDLSVGDTFKLAPRENNTSTPSFVVGAIISYFPTASDPSYTSLVVADLSDYTAMLRNPDLENEFAAFSGPNQVWLRTNGNLRDDLLRAQDLDQSPLAVESVVDRRALQQQAEENPLTAGMAGMLLIGAVLAALLAVLGGIVQSGVAARARTTQFAILRTLGMNRSQMLRMLLGQQVAIYAFGLLCGTALGLALSSATLPFLQFSTSALDPTQRIVPPFLLVFQPLGLALFYTGLVAAFLLGLFIAARAAARIGLGRALRIGED
jgi:ABC-type lipoprotein release transport system permease subunit